MKKIFSICLSLAALAFLLLPFAASAAETLNFKPETLNKIAMPVLSTTFTPVENFTLVTLDDAKRQVRLELDFTDEDTQLMGYVAGAVSAAEAYLEAGPLTDKTMLILQDDAAKIVSPVEKAALQSIEVQTVVGGGFVVLNPEDYQTGYTMGENAIAYPSVTFIDESFTVNQLRSTWLVPLPPAIKSAVLLKVSDLYEIRGERNIALDTSFYNLLRPYRKFN